MNHFLSHLFYSNSPNKFFNCELKGGVKKTSFIYFYKISQKELQIIFSQGILYGMLGTERERGNAGMGGKELEGGWLSEKYRLKSRLNKTVQQNSMSRNFLDKTKWSQRSSTVLIFQFIE